MHIARLFPSQDRRLRKKDSGNQAAAHRDFGGVELPRGCSLGTESVYGVGDQETQAERRKRQALSRSETMREDDRGHRHGRRQARTGRQGLRRSSLPHPPSQHALSAASRAGAGGGTEAHRKRETGHHDSPSYLGYDPPTRIGSRSAGGAIGEGH